MFIDFRERGKNDVRNIDWLPPIRAPSGEQTHNLGMCPDGGQNPQHSVGWADAPTKEQSHPARARLVIFNDCWCHIMSNWKTL